MDDVPQIQKIVGVTFSRSSTDRKVELLYRNRNLHVTLKPRTVVGHTKRSSRMKSCSREPQFPSILLKLYQAHCSNITVDMYKISDNLA